MLRVAIAFGRARATLEQWFIYGPYRGAMRLAHRFNWHYAPPVSIEGDVLRRCQWCGLSHVTRAGDPAKLIRHNSPPKSGAGAADHGGPAPSAGDLPSRETIVEAKRLFADWDPLAEPLADLRRVEGVARLIA